MIYMTHKAMVFVSIEIQSLFIAIMNFLCDVQDWWFYNGENYGISALKGSFYLAISKLIADRMQKIFYSIAEDSGFIK